VLDRVREELHGRGVTMVLSGVIEPVRAQLDRYGISAALGPHAWYDTAGEVLEAYLAAYPAAGTHDIGGAV